MSLMNYFPAILAQLVFDIPLFIVWLVAVIFAIVRWIKHPKVSLLTIIAICIFITTNFISKTLVFLPYFMRENYGTSEAGFGLMSFGINAILLLFNTTAWALIVAAIFGWRKSLQASNTDSSGVPNA